MRPSLRLTLLILAALVQPLCVADEPVSFTRDVRPILSDTCFACHGPDEEKREADLRLDVAESAMESGAISSGEVDASELWNRITSDDPSDVMPPPEFHKQLTEAQRGLIRQWIEAGAKYQQHWSFVAPTKPDVPSGDVDNPIDAFLQDRLRAKDYHRRRRPIDEL